MARILGIFLLVAIGLVTQSDCLRSNLKLALYRMLKNEVVAEAADQAWHVLLLRPFEMCSGSIVSRDWVITAAHCVHRTDPAYIAVMPVAADFDLDAFHTVSSYVIHDHYDAYSRHNDVALVRVADCFQLSGNVKAIELSTGHLAPGAVGWQAQFCFLEDDTDAMVVVSNRTVVASGDCEQLYGAPLPAPAVCASGDGSGDGGCEQEDEAVCFAQAGGALVADGALAAVLTWSGSWSHPPTATDVYVDVAYLRHWVEQVCAI